MKRWHRQYLFIRSRKGGPIGGDLSGDFGKTQIGTYDMCVPCINAFTFITVESVLEKQCVGCWHSFGRIKNGSQLLQSYGMNTKLQFTSTTENTSSGGKGGGMECREQHCLSANKMAGK